MMLLAFINERDAPPVRDQPHIDAASWRMFQGASGELRLVVRRSEITFRTTTRVVSVSFERTVVQTTSGRTYHLAGPPETNEFVLEIIRANAARAGLQTDNDVSDDFWHELQAGRAGGPLGLLDPTA